MSKSFFTGVILSGVGFSSLPEWWNFQYSLSWGGPEGRVQRLVRSAAKPPPMQEANIHT